jgi:endoglycosylceramidase
MRILLLLLLLCLLTFVNGFISVNNTRFIDKKGQERIFHGTNVVYKGFPYHPDIEGFDPKLSFSEKDVKILYDLGFNIIRLGVMWPGVEPIKDQYNQTYFNVLKNITGFLKKYDMFYILDFHQDLLNEQFCGEGVPTWFIDKDPNFPEPLDRPFNKIPSREECNKHNWILYQMSTSLNKGYQYFYDNHEKFVDFWKKVASEFKDDENCLGYEIINEPWPGDMYKYPSLIDPHVAIKKNLMRIYKNVTEGIREIDNNHLILYEPVTWDVINIGFEKLWNNSVLSYHGYFPPNIDIDIMIKSRSRDIKRLNVGGILTEFDLEPTKTLELLNMADQYMQSWLNWEYKEFYPITGANEGFFKSDGSYHDIVWILSRPYPQIIGGNLINFTYDNTIKHIKFEMICKKNLRTIIYVGDMVKIMTFTQNVKHWIDNKRIFIENGDYNGYFKLNVIL